jgi:uncharacterized repeat protein (TIGR03803 family)
VLIGLTSNGGPQGKGTAFTIKPSGNDFNLLKGFSDWGKAPNGDLYKNDDGNFYGMTSVGGTYDYGSIFTITPEGNVTILKQLNSFTDGATPLGELIKGTDGNFYGMTSAGGTNGYGVIFKITPAGVYTVLRHLAFSTDGTNPKGHLVQAADGNFYGITYGGGANLGGTIFKITPSGTFTVLRALNKTTDGGNSYSSLTLGSDGSLYGITNSGGTLGFGTIFKITTSGTFTVLRNFNGTTDGGSSQSDLLLASDGNFYSMCYGGGNNGNGTIFKITPGGTYTVLKHLSSSVDGALPYGNLYQNSDGVLYGMMKNGGASGNGTAFKITTSGTYTVLHSFVSATEGATPTGGFTKGNDGNLYGMTTYGGTLTGGTAFKMTTSGTVTVIANFNGAAQGNAPLETLVKGADNAYYGTASSGGEFGYGTIFKICGGTTTVLHSFSKTTEGSVPKGSLIQATDGNFYGMTSEGGTNNSGTIFKITPNGNYSVIRHLSAVADGSNPQGSLVQGTDGLLYGITYAGGSSGSGTIFKIATTGTYTVLRHLTYANDGANTEGSLVQGTDGNFYGMTSNNARIFKISSTGTFTVLRTLTSSTDGTSPLGSLVLSADGNFYGTTSTGGTFGGGTIFKISSSGTFSVLKHLNATPDGKMPKGNLLVASDGNFYGTTSSGGTNNIGTIFKITPSGTYTVLRNFTMSTDGGSPNGSLILAAVNNIVANPLTITTDEDKKKAFTMTGSGGSPLTFTIVTQPVKGSITEDFKYKPNKNYAGTDSFFYISSVGCLSSAPAKVSVTVTSVPDAPVLDPIGNKSVAKNNTLSFTATAKDVDKGQTITFSLISAPAGATIGSTNGKFSWTPTATGSFTFKVRVTDNDNPPLFDEESITVTVTSFGEKTMESNEQELIQEVIYPNPAQSVFNISLNNHPDEVTVTLLDVKGSVVRRATFESAGKNSISMDVVDLQNGMYVVQLMMDGKVQYLKFVKN